MADASPCDRCGAPSVAEAGDESLCADCFHEAGSCCGRFGGDEQEAP
ncbi:MAG: hypothetical protein KF712_10425 [Akkermansiaceae bacterium]|nr:hypothetical protein [Akkermansiaceae bacterium]